MKNKKKLLSLFFTGLLIMMLVIPVTASEGKVNINTAGKEQLMTLKYIGEEYAQRIIEYRTNQKFENPEDILKVKGIGQKTFDANKEIIVVKE